MTIVLDYAKINKLRQGSTSRKRLNGQRVGQKKDHVSSIVGLTTNFDLASLVEEGKFAPFFLFNSSVYESHTDVLRQA